jgi:hypothetical protein
VGGIARPRLPPVVAPSDGEVTRDEAGIRRSPRRGVDICHGEFWVADRPVVTRSRVASPTPIGIQSRVSIHIETDDSAVQTI